MSSPSSNELVRRPFEGLPNEQDLVAMRQLIPAATMAARTTEEYGSLDVELATVLPMAWPAVRRTDGSVTVGIQAGYPGGDLSRGIGQAIRLAAALEPGNPITTVTLDDDAPRPRARRARGRAARAAPGTRPQPPPEPPPDAP